MTTRPRLIRFRRGFGQALPLPGGATAVEARQSTRPELTKQELRIPTACAMASRGWTSQADAPLLAGAALMKDRVTHTF